MMSGIPIVVYIDDQTSKGLANILQSTRRVTTATERWGSSATRATKEVNSSFTDLLGRLYALRYGMTRLFEGLSGYTQMTQMKMSFRALGGNLEQLRGVTQGLTSDYELLNIGIQMAAVGVNKQLTAAFLKAGTGVKQTMGNIVNLNELVESIIQGRTYMYFDKYLPGIARYGKELKEAQKESDALVRTQKTLQIVMKHMDELSSGMYGNVSSANKAMMGLQATVQNLGKTVFPIFEGLSSVIIALAGIRVLKPIKLYKSWFKNFSELEFLQKMLDLSGRTETELPMEKLSKYSLKYWGKIVSLFGSTLFRAFSGIIRWIAIPLAILSGLWKGIQGSALFKGIGAGIAGYDITTGITRMSRGLQLELQSKGVLNLVRSFMWLWHQGAQFVSGFLSVFKGIFSAIQSVGHAIGNLIKKVLGIGALADIFGEGGLFFKAQGYLWGMVAALGVLGPAIGKVYTLLGPWGIILTIIGSLILILADELGGFGNAAVLVGMTVKNALFNILLAITNVIDGILIAFNRAAVFIPNLLGAGLPKYQMGDIARTVGMSGKYATMEDTQNEFRDYLTRKALAEPQPQFDTSKTNALLEDIKKTLQEGKTIELDGYKLNKATEGYNKQQERRGQ